MRLNILRYFRVAIVCGLAALLTCRLRADPGQLVVHVDRPGVSISPMLYGLMTEEINHSYDGGLYAELIQNRAFKDDAAQPVHWSLIKSSLASAEMTIDRSDPVNAALSSSLRIDVADASTPVGIANDGYWGIPVKPSTRYNVSFYARASAGFSGMLRVAIESSDGKTVWAEGQVDHVSQTWKMCHLTLSTAGGITPSTANRFALYVTGAGKVWLSQVSLFPPTYHNRPNGNRVDLMQDLAVMKPAFLRLPGGNYLEGDTIADRFAWKSTIHDKATRPGHRCPWGYRSSDGLGLLEFLEWCEDLKMQPILAVYAGYSLRGEHIDPGAKLQPFVDDALDEIEYATGDRSTKWGAERAADGHPAPFKIEYIEIGNEDLFDRSGSYDGRFTQFFDAIRAKYPSLKQIATTSVRSRIPDVVDDHYYRSAAEMERDAHHYDRYSRSGPKIFVGEWASTEGSPTPTLQAALGDAAWMTGMERNSDLIPISCYAPLLVNVNRGASQWGTNLIGYDALRSFGSPSYYAQMMFANNRGDTVLPVEIVPQNIVAPKLTTLPHGGVGLGTWETAADFKDIKVTNGDETLYSWDAAAGTSGWSARGGNWSGDRTVIHQDRIGVDCRLTIGGASWQNYSYSLKARKISGAEGFLIMFHVRDAQNYLWWNIGGWGNTRTAIERSTNGAKQTVGLPLDFTVETGRWYDIRIEVAGTRIRCYIDGKLQAEAQDLPGDTGVDPIFATASLDRATGGVILKVVNVSPEAQELQVDLQGVAHVGKATVIEMAGNAADVNTLAEPDKITPTTTTLRPGSSKFVHSFPAHSVTILRVNAR